MSCTVLFIEGFPTSPAHLTFSRKTMGAAILEKLSLKKRFWLCVSHRELLKESFCTSHIFLRDYEGCHIGKTLFKKRFWLHVPHMELLKREFLHNSDSL